jgi:hypothetical protein
MQGLKQMTLLKTLWDAETARNTTTAEDKVRENNAWAAIQRNKAIDDQIEILELEKKILRMDMEIELTALEIQTNAAK